MSRTSKGETSHRAPDKISPVSSSLFTHAEKKQKLHKAQNTDVGKRVFSAPASFAKHLRVLTKAPEGPENASGQRLTKMRVRHNWRGERNLCGIKIFWAWGKPFYKVFPKIIL